MSFLDANLFSYGVQILVVVLAAAGIALLLGGGDPRVRLWHWQAALMVALVAPFFGRWETLEADSVSVVMSASQVVTGDAAQGNGTVPWRGVALSVLLIVSAGFLLRLSAGAVRLHRYRKGSRAAEGFEGVGECRVSDEVTTPVTFGLWRPVILLPAYVSELPRAQQEAIVLHEAVHVRRKDWGMAVMEELIRTLLWFHPGIWFVLHRIQVEREHVVDWEVMRQTADPDAYLDALVAIAGRKGKLDLLPASLFLRKRYLAERVANILKGGTTMKTKSIATALALSSAAVFSAAFLTSTFVPLQAVAQEQRQETAQGARKSGPRVIHMTQAEYPPVAKLKGIEGTVQLEAIVDANGLVTEARVLAGPEDLRRAAVQAVLQWQFAPGEAGNRAEVEMNFVLAAARSERRTVGVVQRIEYVNVPQALRERIAPRIGLKEGDSIPSGAEREVQRALKEVDPNLIAQLTADQVLRIVQVAPAIKVGGNVMAAKLKSKTAPKYPMEAKQARIQGTVRYSVRIGKDGKITNMELVAGHPMLAEAAFEAVKTWEYEPTLLNGNPVEVMTMIDVNFTLAP